MVQTQQKFKLRHYRSAMQTGGIAPNGVRVVVRPGQNATPDLQRN
jgi:hypothetical protein